MNLQDFQQMFIRVASCGWSRWDGEKYIDTTAEYMAKANNLKECAKIHKSVKLVAYRNCVSEHDALHILMHRNRI